jgi:mRNA interferase HigB
VDYGAPYTVFDVGGNSFRVIAVIHYNRQKLYIREVFTHAEYDRWSKALRRTRS